LRDRTHTSAEDVPLFAASLCSSDSGGLRLSSPSLMSFVSAFILKLLQDQKVTDVQISFLFSQKGEFVNLCSSLFRIVASIIILEYSFSPNTTRSMYWFSLLLNLIYRCRLIIEICRYFSFMVISVDIALVMQNSIHIRSVCE